MEAPIPPPRLDDDEDVHWALSTAGALWGRGERAEALKWLRRAAEQASDVNADQRALELFKAAADVAGKVNAVSAPPPAPAPPAPPPAPSSAAAPSGPASAEITPRPPPAPPPRKAPPAPPPRPGSVFPPPPAPTTVGARPGATPAPPSRPPSVPAPPPRPPGVPPRTVPPPVAASRTPPPSPAKPAAPIAPVIAAPTRPVAITTATPTGRVAAPPPVVSKRRRSFTGEARPGAERSRGGEAARGRHASAPEPRHTRRRTYDEEETRPPPPPVEVTPVQAAPPPADPSSIFDDLDEDTRVIKPQRDGEDEISRALDRLRAAPVPHIPEPPLTEPARPPEPSRPRASAPEDEATTIGSLAQIAEARERAAPSSERGGPQTERPPSMVEVPLQPRKRLDTLPSLRVAVLGTGVAGEVRLISLDTGDEPPPGAALAVLVPLSGADGEAVARLFGAVD